MQAQKLAQRGQLRIAFLEYRGELIAFEYGWAAKGIYFTPKVGYDASYRQLGPSQVLRAALIEQMFGDPHWQLLDFCGPACRATSEWRTRDYPIGRLVVATNLLGRSLLRTYKMLAPVTRRLREERRKPVGQTLSTIDASHTAESLVG